MTNPKVFKTGLNTSDNSGGGIYSKKSSSSFFFLKKKLSKDKNRVPRLESCPRDKNFRCHLLPTFKNKKIEEENIKMKNLSLEPLKRLLKKNTSLKST